MLRNSLIGIGEGYIYTVRIILAFCLLSVCTYTDIKEKNIYHIPVILAGLCGIVISVVFNIITPSTHEEYSVRELVIQLIMCVSVCVIAFLSNGTIGMGDAYMFSGLCFIVGSVMSIRIVSAGIILSGLAMVVTYICGRIKDNDSVPFAPFLLLGFLWTCLF